MSVPFAIFLGFLAGIAVSSVGLAWFARWVRRRIAGLTAPPDEIREVSRDWYDLADEYLERNPVHHDPQDFQNGWVYGLRAPVDPDSQGRLSPSEQGRLNYIYREAEQLWSVHTPHHMADLHEERRRDLEQEYVSAGGARESLPWNVPTPPSSANVHNEPFESHQRLSPPPPESGWQPVLDPSVRPDHATPPPLGSAVVQLQVPPPGERAR